MQKAGRVTELRLQRAGADASANYAGADASANNEPFTRFGSLLAAIATCDKHVSADNEPANVSANNEPFTRFGCLLAAIVATVGKSERCSQLHAVQAADDCAL